MKIFQSKLNGEILIAYEVYRKSESLETQLLGGQWECSIREQDIVLGILIEYKNGYVGLFKSWDVLYRQCEYVGEL